jgi:hypothetical protein
LIYFLFLPSFLHNMSTTAAPAGKATPAGKASRKRKLSDTNDSASSTSTATDTPLPSTRTKKDRRAKLHAADADLTAALFGGTASVLSALDRTTTTETLGLDFLDTIADPHADAAVDADGSKKKRKTQAPTPAWVDEDDELVQVDVVCHHNRPVLLYSLLLVGVSGFTNAKAQTSNH